MERSRESAHPAGLRGLRVYEEAVLLADRVHAATAGLARPGDGRLQAQMRAAAESVYANIAEGHGRPSKADRARFLAMAWASLVELEAHVQHATRCDLLIPADAIELRNRCRWTGRLLAALRRAMPR